MDQETIDRVVARLRDSAKQEAEQNRADGMLAGREWAIEQAGYKDLRRVAETQQGEEDDLTDFFEDADPDWHPEQVGSADWREGFVQGAWEVWQEVRMKV